MISRAASGDDVTTTGTSFLELDVDEGRLEPARDVRHGMVGSGLPSMWWRLPMTGGRHGRGGSLRPLLSRLLSLRSKRGRSAKKRHR
jgi:hypothetical protein